MGVNFISEFSLKEFSNKNVNTKIKIFIQYLYEKYAVSPDSGEFDNEYFSLLNDDDLIESLQYYIAKNNVTAQVTASNYITYITDFFNMLSTEYSIKNEIFMEVSLHKRFSSKCKKIISELKISVSKDIASDDEYEKLNDGIEKFLDQLVIVDYYREIERYANNEITKVSMHNKFVSCIALKLIMKFGIKSLTTISLEINNLDIENQTLLINNFYLELDEELTQLFRNYLEIRKYILKMLSIEEDKLFIKYSGKPYITYLGYENDIIRKDYGSFFKITRDNIGNGSVDLFTARRVLEMLNKGVDITTVAKLSNMSISKCAKLQDDSNEYDNNKRLQFFLQNKETGLEKKFIKKKVINENRDYLQCPFCSQDTKATSEEWILVQFENNNTKYLSCKNCGGGNGKYTI